MSEQPAGAARTVTWTEMQHGTKADYEMLGPLFEEHARGSLVGNLITLLDLLKGPKLGYQVDRYEHSLQSASRALRAEESVDLVVGALLHDIADGFAPENHSSAAATLLAPYVDQNTHDVIKHHGVFQGYYYFHHVGGDRNERDRYTDASWFDDCARFCAEYDQNCFDPDYNTLPFDTFVPMLEEVFGREPRGWA